MSLKDLNKKEGINIQSASELEKVEFVKTGIYKLDKLINGLPKGKFIQITGDPKAGKSSLCLDIIKEFQEKGLKVLYGDLERWLNTAIKWAKRIGIDLNSLLHMTTDNAEQMFDTIIQAALSEEVDVIIIDSVTAVGTQSEKETIVKESMDEDSTMGLTTARVLSKFFRNAVGLVNDYGKIVVLVNQTRIETRGRNIFTVKGYSGGYALKHNLSLNLRLRRKNVERDKNGVTKELEIEASVMKSRLDNVNEGESTSLILIPGEGYAKEPDYLQKLVDDGKINYKKGWYKVDGIESSFRESDLREYDLKKLDQMTKEEIGDFLEEDQ